jgi:hypothetical protein
MQFTDLSLRIPTSISVAREVLSGPLRAAKTAADIAMSQANLRTAALASTISDVERTLSPLRGLAERKLQMASFIPLALSDVETWSRLSLRLTESLTSIDTATISGLILLFSAPTPAALLNLADKLADFTGTTITLDGLRWDDTPEELDRTHQSLPSYQELSLGEAIPKLGTASAMIDTLLDVTSRSLGSKGLAIQNARTIKGATDRLEEIQRRLDSLTLPELAGVRVLWIDDLPREESYVIINAPGAPSSEEYAAAVVFVTDIQTLRDIL